MTDQQHYDVVIVGAGIAGSIVAYELGRKGKRVLVLEAGPAISEDRSTYLDRFYSAISKSPTAPYPPLTSESDPAGQNTPRPTIPMLINYKKYPYTSYLIQQGPLPFGSTYDRVGGGTTQHWMGTALRLLPTDFRLRSNYGHGLDWPNAIDYDSMQTYYEQAEAEIGVSADKASQYYMKGLYRPGYEYPMPGIKQSLLDMHMTETMGEMHWDNKLLQITPIPQGRNSVPRDSRRACAGNTSCTPICPIQAKYDATSTMKKALNTGNVSVLYQCVANNISIDYDNGRVTGIDYITYDGPTGPRTGSGTAVGTHYVLAAHAIETPKLLLNSANNRLLRGVANSSDQVGRNLMDQPSYLAWAMMPKPCYSYRGPLATSSIENLRDGPFRKQHAAFRMEIGNDGWKFPINDPGVTCQDFIDGTNHSQLNPDNKRLVGPPLVRALNAQLIRQMRVINLTEQLADPNNRVTLSKTHTDLLGIPRPCIHYDIDDYTRKSFVVARRVMKALFHKMGATRYTQTIKQEATYFEVDVPVGNGNVKPEGFNYFGAGHIYGTSLMGDSRFSSVLNGDQQSWDHANLFMTGSGNFPSVGAANPTLTIAALAFRCAQTVAAKLAG